MPLITANARKNTASTYIDPIDEDLAQHVWYADNAGMLFNTDHGRLHRVIACRKYHYGYIPNHIAVKFHDGNPANCSRDNIFIDKPKPAGFWR